MNYLPLNLRKNYPENRVTNTTPLPEGVANYARLIPFPLGIVFDDDVIVSVDGAELIEGVDYLLSGYSKHFKHLYNMNGYGILAITNPQLSGDITYTVTYVGGDYVVFDKVGIPDMVPLIGNGIEQILWDNVVTGPYTDTRALTGQYPPSKKIGIDGVANLINLLADQAVEDGPIADRETVRNLITENTTNVLEKIPAGLTTDSETVVGAINDIRILNDTAQGETKLNGVLYSDIDLTAFTDTVRSGWGIGANGIVVTGPFFDNSTSKTVNTGDTILYDPTTAKLYLNQNSVDLISTPLFDKSRPPGTCAQLLTGNTVEQWNHNAFRLIMGWWGYLGVISSVRENTTLTRADVAELKTSYYVVGEDDLNVTYPTFINGIDTPVTETLNLGDIVYFSSSDKPTRILKGYHHLWTPDYEDGASLHKRILDVKDKISKLSNRPLGEIFESLITTPDERYLEANGQAVSRTDYAELFSLIGTTFGNGDGVTTFGLPSHSTLSSTTRHELDKITTNLAPDRYDVTLTNHADYALIWDALGNIKRVHLKTGDVVSLTLVGKPVYVPEWNEVLVYNTTNQLVILNVATLETTLKGSYGAQTLTHFATYRGRLFGFGSHVVEITQAGAVTVLGAYALGGKVNGAVITANNNILLFIDGATGKALTLATGEVSNVPALNTTGQGFIGNRGDADPILYDAGDGALYTINLTSVTLTPDGNMFPKLSGFTSSSKKPDKLWAWVNNHLITRYKLPELTQYIVAKGV